MKILVLSDSHSGLSYMRSWINAVKPDVIIHLGDHYDDGQEMELEFRDSRMIQVPGNCDLYRISPGAREILTVNLGGVVFFLTHGHRHGVKSDTIPLIAAARSAEANAALYGHTHRADCRIFEDGFLVLNPGSCGSSSGSVGLIEVEDRKIKSAKILYRDDLDLFH